MISTRELLRAGRPEPTPCAGVGEVETVDDEHLHYGDISCLTCDRPFRVRVRSGYLVVPWHRAASPDQGSNSD